MSYKEKKSDKQENKSLSDWVKKAVTTGVGAVFLTEETIRQGLLELKMPKSVISSALIQAEKTKKEIATLMAKEVRAFLDNIELEEIIKRIITGANIEISAKISFNQPNNKSKTYLKNFSKKGTSTKDK